MSLTTLATKLKGEPGVWSIHPATIPPAPAGDAAATHHGHGERPAIPSYQHRMILTVAVDCVRMYYLADSVVDPAEKSVLTDGATLLFTNAGCDTVPEAELLRLILGHWPLPPPSFWLLRLVNAVGDYQTALTFPPASGGALLTASINRIKVLVDALKPGGDGGAGTSGPH